MTSITKDSSNLEERIKELGLNFRRISNELDSSAMQSRPSFVLFYTDLAENYRNAADACEKYLLNKDIVRFVCKMIDLGFYLETIQLKKRIHNPVALNEIEIMQNKFDLNFELSL